MPRGIDSAGDTNRRPPGQSGQSFEIVPGYATGTSPDRVQYSLVGHGPGGDQGHGALRFGTQEDAMAHMEKHGLQHAGRPSDDPWRGQG